MNDNGKAVKLAVHENEIKHMNLKLDSISNKLEAYNATVIKAMILDTDLCQFKKVNDDQHKNFISKAGFYTISTILGVIIVAITILQFVLGR